MKYLSEEMNQIMKKVKRSYGEITGKRRKEQKVKDITINFERVQNIPRPFKLNDPQSSISPSPSLLFLSCDNYNIPN